MVFGVINNVGVCNAGASMDPSQPVLPLLQYFEARALHHHRQQ
jgi:hypothetical protein